MVDIPSKIIVCFVVAIMGGAVLCSAETPQPEEPGTVRIPPAWPREPDPEGIIWITPDLNREAISFVGKGQIKKAEGKPEDIAQSLEAFGRSIDQIVQIGVWSNDNMDPTQAIFSAAVPQDGVYEVYVYPLKHPFVGEKLTSFQVDHAKGSVKLNLPRHIGNQWAFLGAYPFKAEKNAILTCDITGTKSNAAFAGVKLVPVANPEKTLASQPKVLPVLPNSSDELDALRLRFADLETPAHNANLTSPLVASKVAQEQAQAYWAWKTLSKKEGIVDLWDDIALNHVKPIAENKGGGWQLFKTFERLRSMARAYVGSNAELGFASKMQGNPQLLQDIIYALHWLNKNRYNVDSKNCMGADWIGMELINPLHISATIALILPHVPKELHDKYIATFNKMSDDPRRMYGKIGPTTGFNRMLAAKAWATRGIAEKDASKLESIAGLVGEEMDLNVRSRPILRDKKPDFDGFYADGSFIQHVNFPYIGIYGNGQLRNYAEVLQMLSGSPWSINDPRASVFTDWVLKGYAPLISEGDITYGSLGRSTGQSWHQNGAVMTEVLDAVLSYLRGANSSDRDKISPVVKKWIVDRENCAFPEFNHLDAKRITLDNLLLMDAIAKNSTITPYSPENGSKIFYNTDYVIHRQPGFLGHLRMFSTRIKTHEDIDGGTNRTGWYQGTGALLIYDRDNSKYNDNFWATVNPYRLPGTTVNNRERLVPGSKDGLLSPSPWAGGVSINGFGLASMGLEEPNDLPLKEGGKPSPVRTVLTAKKAWFFIEDAIVCLGNSISGKEGHTVETIVENLKLNAQGNNSFTVNGKVEPDALGWSADLNGVEWAHLSGNIPESGIGWVFPGGASLKAMREARKQTWRVSFLKDIDQVEHTRNYLTLWYDHGIDPVQGAYSYIILPGRSAEAVQSYAAKPGIEILANTAEVQAISSKSHGIVAANFWTDAGGNIGGITSSGKAAIIVQQKDGKIGIAISDPTQLEKSVEIALNTSAASELYSDPEVKILSLNPVKISVDLTKSDGKGFKAEFQK